MPQRLRLYDCRLSRLSSVIGICQADVGSTANAVNGAQRRLLYAKEAGEEGWYGTFAEVVFNVSRTSPQITLPREMARLEALNVCDRPYPVQNQFYEYLQFGNGRLPKNFRCTDRVGLLQTVGRNNAVTFVDLANPPQILTIYSDPADVGKRVFISGTDNHDNVIYTQDNANQVQGVFVALNQPFATAPMQFNSITGIQKDVTVGPVQIFQTDPVSGAQVLLLTMQPGEMTAWYRRYYLDQVPCGCCGTPVPSVTACPTVQVRAIVKLELIPVVVDTDYCLLQNLEAIIEEANSIRYSEIDSSAAKQMAQERHIQAIRLLNGELNHYLGMNTPAVDFSPFGSARLENKCIGNLI